MAGRFEVPDTLKEKWVSVKEAMQLLDISRDTVTRWRREGKLVAREYYGDHILISRDSINALMAPFV